MPPRAAELAVGSKLEANLLLLGDDLDDLGILDLLQLGIADLAFLVLGARLLDRRGAQEAADMVGAEWRLAAWRHGFLRELSRHFGRASAIFHLRMILSENRFPLFGIMPY